MWFVSSNKTSVQLCKEYQWCTKHSPILMHFSGDELQPCTHLASHSTPCTIWETQTHTQSHWSLAKIALVFEPSELQLHSHAVRKPLSLGLFMSADVWTREAGRELKTLRTHDRSRKSRCYALSNLFSFLFEFIKAVMLGFHISRIRAAGLRGWLSYNPLSCQSHTTRTKDLWESGKLAL